MFSSKQSKLRDDENSYVGGSISTVIWISVILAWVLFILVGTLFYAYYDDYGWALGFFMAIDVGYQVGYCYNIDTSRDSKFFDVFYTCIGTIFIFAFIVFLFEIVINSHDRWFTKFIRKRFSDLPISKSYFDQFIEFCDDYFYSIISAIAVYVFVLIGTAWSCYYVQWTILDGVFFSLSMLVRCGMQFIPSDSPDWYFAFVGLYTAVGSVVFGVAVFVLAENALANIRYARAEEAIREPASKEELRFLRTIEAVQDEDDLMTKNEFVLLVTLRLGLVDVELVRHIFQHFDDLNTEKRSKVPIRKVFASKSLRLIMEKSGSSDSDLLSHWRSKSTDDSDNSSHPGSFDEHDDHTAGNGFFGGVGGRGRVLWKNLVRSAADPMSTFSNLGDMVSGTAGGSGGGGYGGVDRPSAEELSAPAAAAAAGRRGDSRSSNEEDAEAQSPLIHPSKTWWISEEDEN